MGKDENDDRARSEDHGGMSGGCEAEANGEEKLVEAQEKTQIGEGPDIARAKSSAVSLEKIEWEYNKRGQLDPKSPRRDPIDVTQRSLARDVVKGPHRKQSKKSENNEEWSRAIGIGT